MAWELIAELREVGSAHGRILPVVPGKASQTHADWDCRSVQRARLTDAGQNCKRARKAQIAALPPEDY